MNKSLQSIERGIGSLKSGFATLGIALGATALVEAGKHALEYAGSLGAASKQLGVSTHDLQLFRFEARHLGVDQEGVDRGLQKLTKSIGQASVGAKAQQKVFAALGISVRDASGHVKTASDILPEIAKRFQGVSSPAQRAAVEVALFGRAGQQLDPLLRAGGARIDELAEAFKRLNIELSPEQISKAHEAEVAFGDLAQVLKVQFASEIIKNADSIEQLAKSLTDAAIAVAKFNASNPQLAAAALGALVGGRIAGVPGALAGGAVGAGLGSGNVDKQAAGTEAIVAENKRRYGSILGTLTGGLDVLLSSRERLIAHAPKAAAAVVAAGTGTGTGGGGTGLPQFLSEGGGGAGGASKLQPREFINQSAQLDERLLRIKEQMATDTNAIADFVKQQITIEANKIDADILENVSQGHITKAQGQILLAKSKELRAAELLQAEIDRQSQVAKDALNLQLTGITDQKDLLSAQASITRTAAERRAVELKLLALDKQEELLKLDNILADKKASDADKAQAQKRKDDLDRIFAARAQSIIVQNAGPLQDYLRNIPKSIAQINEAMQRLRVDQFDKLNQDTKQFADDLSSAVGQFGQDILDLKNPITALKSLLTSVAHTFQQEFLIKPLTDAFRKKIGAPLAEKLVTDKIGGQTVHGVAGDFGLSAQQMNLAFKTSTSDLLEFARALTVATGSLGGGLNLNGFAGFPPGSIATDSGFQSMVAGLSNNGASIGIDPSELAAVNDNLNVMSGVTAQATSALQAQIPALGQFGNGLLQVLSSLSGGGGGGGFLGGLLKIGGSLAGGIGTKALGLEGIASLKAVGAFASGGRPTGLSLVGENGPELFMPDGPGTIVPAPQSAALMRAMAGARTSVRGGDHYTVNVTGPMTERERRQTGQQIAASIRMEQARAARTGIAA